MGDGQATGLVMDHLFKTNERIDSMRQEITTELRQVK